MRSLKATLRGGTDYVSSPWDWSAFTSRISPGLVAFDNSPYIPARYIAVVIEERGFNCTLEKVEAYGLLMEPEGMCLTLTGALSLLRVSVQYYLGCIIK